MDDAPPAKHNGVFNYRKLLMEQQCEGLKVLFRCREAWLFPRPELMGISYFLSVILDCCVSASVR